MAQRPWATYIVAVAKLLLLFTVVPLVELYLLLQLGELLGLWPTVGIVIATGAVGAWLAKAEGLRVLGKWRSSLARGQIPEEGVLGGLLVLVGGVLLVTPGVLTDLTGLLLLIPPTRKLVADRLRRHVERRMQDGSIQVVSYTSAGSGTGPFRGPGSPRGRPVMDVEAEVVERERPAD